MPTKAKGRTHIAAELGLDFAKIVQFGFMSQWNHRAIDEDTFFGAGDLTGPNDEATIPEQWKAAWHWLYQARHVDHVVPTTAEATDDEYGPGDANLWKKGADIPSHAQFVPNYLKAQERLTAFGQHRRADPALDLDAEIARLETDLTSIFQGK